MLLDILFVSELGLIECKGVLDYEIADYLMIYLYLTWKCPDTKLSFSYKRNFSKFDVTDFVVI